MNRLFQPTIESIETFHVAARPTRPHRSSRRLADAHEKLADFEAQLELHARWGLSAAHKVLFEKHRRKLRNEIARHRAALGE